MSTLSNGASWVPLIDVGKFSKLTAGGFADLVEELINAAKNSPDKPLNLVEGWNIITPEMAEMALLRNPQNRVASFGTVRYYAEQMMRGDWMPTGQPIIFDKNGLLLDGQHRLLAVYLTGTSLTTYVVTSVEPRANLFAYIDNSKPRSNRDALMTTGLNGLSSAIAAGVQMRHAYDLGAYASGQKTARHVARLSPMQVIECVTEEPLLRQAAQLMASDHMPARRLIDSDAISVFVAYKILALYDEDMLDRFMGELGDAPENMESSAIRAFHALIIADAKKGKDKLGTSKKLGNLIQTFNYWISKHPVKRLNLNANVDFPQFIVPGEAPVIE